MTAKEYLRNIRSLNSKINTITDDIAELRAKLMGVGSPETKAEVVSESGGYDPMAEGVAKLVDLCAEWDARVDEWEALARDASRRIDGMRDGTHSKLLRLYYISGKTWEEVAVIMGYTWRWTYKIHGKALVAFERENPDLLKQELSDSLSSINSRLAMINDGTQSLAEFDRAIFNTAQNARTSYLGMTDTISKLGLNAGDAFSSNDELITFADQLNKQYVIAGTNAQGIAAANLQLTQAMASGVLRGEELNSVFENAPTIIAAISKEMGVSKGAIRELAKEGEITADIVKRALLNSVEETNAAFERMPKTWGQVRQMFINDLLKEDIKRQGARLL